jgi:hypothetical protein
MDTNRGAIYLREEDGLVRMTEAPYEAELLLQRLLADYPDLLAGDQMRPGSPRRWLLITQEAAVPDSEGGPGRWSLDHLFVDDEAVSTLVEVKRSTDTRIRREVVGQMLDYAANLPVFWPSGEVRRIFEARCEKERLDPDAEVIRLLGEVAPDEASAGERVDAFWQRVSDSLAARHLRLVFVADDIPRELQRIIEFLNEGLLRIEVLGVEVKQYVGGGRQTLVPRVIGNTATAEQAKQVAGGRSRSDHAWDDDTFLAAVRTTGRPETERLVHDARTWAASVGLPVRYGKGRTGPLYIDAPDKTGTAVPLMGISVEGSVLVDYSTLRKSPPFDDVAPRLALHDRLVAIPGAILNRQAAETGTWYHLPRGLFGSDEGRRSFLAALAWMADRLSGA